MQTISGIGWSDVDQTCSGKIVINTEEERKIFVLGPKKTYKEENLYFGTKKKMFAKLHPTFCFGQ